MFCFWTSCCSDVMQYCSVKKLRNLPFSELHNWLLASSLSVIFLYLDIEYDYCTARSDCYRRIILHCTLTSPILNHMMRMFCKTSKTNWSSVEWLSCSLNNAIQSLNLGSGVHTWITTTQHEGLRAKDCPLTLPAARAACVKSWMH